MELIDFCWYLLNAKSVVLLLECYDVCCNWSAKYSTLFFYVCRFLEPLARQMRQFGQDFPSCLELRSTLSSISEYYFLLFFFFKIYYSTKLKGAFRFSHAYHCFPRLPALGDTGLAFWPPLVILSVKYLFFLFVLITDMFFSGITYYVRNSQLLLSLAHQFSLMLDLTC